MITSKQNNIKSNSEIELNFRDVELNEEEIQLLNNLDKEIGNIQSEIISNMELNWKVMHGIEEMNTERNFLYNILRNVEVK